MAEINLDDDSVATNNQFPSNPPLLSLPSTPTPPLAEPTATATAVRGRHSRFSASQDLLLLREVSASNAHVSAFGESRKRFSDAADKINASTVFSQTITWKTVRDRYKRLQDHFDKKDNANQRMSGVGGELTEMEELLMGMREARDDLRTAKDAKRTAELETERRKEAIGASLVERSLKRAAPQQEGSDGDDSELEIVGSVRKAPRRARRAGVGEMEAFGDSMKEADMARVKLDEERLRFEMAQYESGRAERAKDRAERREEAEREREERRKEREQDRAADMEKYKLLIEALTRK